MKQADSHTGARPVAQPLRLWRGLLQVAVFVALLGLVAFAAAGRLDWTWAWLLLLTYVASLALTLFLLGDDPELLAERGRAGAGVKPWDRFFSVVPALGMLSILLVSGLDFGRSGWSPPLAPAVHLAGWLVMVLAYALVMWAMRSNTFFSRVVRIQADRGHQVVSVGPYARVRHPGYVGMAALGIGMPLLLGSLWALVPGALQVILIVVRTALEDRTLQAELPGYREYAARVRYRLIPGVW